MKPGPSMRVALALICIGAVMAIPAGVLVSVRAFKAINAPSLTTPGTLQRQLKAGTWLVAQNTGSRSGALGFTFGHNNAPDLEPNQVKVTGPDGSQLPVERVKVHQTITKGSRIYTAAVQFDVHSPGAYTIRVDTATRRSHTAQPAMTAPPFSRRG
ncbi:MAG: hypothetical protein M3083_11225 [Actinomycetota bacterium]|nr:hypothetical protein [Actinomycetota bacterium]